jgi:outer membrane protein assembly factor BamD
MFLRKVQFLLSLLAAFWLQSCNEYQKALKNTDIKAKYDLAEKYYEAGDFKRANRLFEQIAPQYVGKPQGERVMFFLSNSYFEQKDYNMAGYQFERFVKSYPKSDKLTQASFLGAKSYYELSPKYSLDQTDTDKALLKLQNFINAYSESEYFDEANAMAKELTTKKERKAFEIMMQYNKIGEFNYDMLKSAMAASDNFISDFPGSEFREKAMYIKVEAATNLAMNSFESLQEERFNTAKAAYNTFVKQYPDSSFREAAEELYKKIENGLQPFTEVSK